MSNLIDEYHAVQLANLEDLSIRARFLNGGHVSATEHSLIKISIQYSLSEIK
jgi:hypothetical protein